MKRLTLLFSICVVVISCKTTGYQKIGAKLNDPMQDFSILSVPREQIPIGSEWIQNIGPKNSTIKDLEVTNKKSLSQYNLSQEFKTRLNLALFDFIGIGGDYRKQIDINIKSMSIVRPTNLQDLNLIPGKSFLFEGILVEEFSMSFDKNIGLDIEAIWESKTGEIEVSSTTGNSKVADVKASNVFLAYRIITVKEVIREKKQTQKVKNNENVNYIWDFKNYKVVFNKNRINNCFLNKKNENPYASVADNKIYFGRMMEEFGECLLSDPVIFNISSEEIYDSEDGTLFNKTYLFTQDQFQFYVDYIEMNNKRYPLSNTVLNNEIVQDYLLVDSFKLIPWPYYDQTKKNPLNISNEVKVDEKSTISFFRNRIQVTNMKNASASGW